MKNEFFYYKSRILTRKAAKVTYCLQIKNCYCIKATDSLNQFFFQPAMRIPFCIYWTSNNLESKLRSPQISKKPEIHSGCILSAFGSFFRRIEETINCFPDLLTFTAFEKKVWAQKGRIKVCKQLTVVQSFAIVWVINLQTLAICICI